jgi:hypothetical protein
MRIVNCTWCRNVGRSSNWSGPLNARRHSSTNSSGTNARELMKPMRTMLISSQWCLGTRSYGPNKYRRPSKAIAFASQQEVGLASAFQRTAMFMMMNRGIATRRILPFSRAVGPGMLRKRSTNVTRLFQESGVCPACNICALSRVTKSRAAGGTEPRSANVTAGDGDFSFMAACLT